MESLLKKRKLRIIAIVVALVAVVGIVAVRTKIEPAETKAAAQESGQENSRSGVIIEADEEKEDQTAAKAEQHDAENSDKTKEAIETEEEKSEDSEAEDEVSQDSDIDEGEDSSTGESGGTGIVSGGEVPYGNDGAGTSKSSTTKSSATKKKKSNTVTKKNAKKSADKTKTDSKAKIESNTDKDTDKTATENGTIIVSLEIRCDTLVKNPDKLKDNSLAQYIPRNGKILATTKYQCKVGTSVYDVLYDICRTKDIQLDTEYTAMYDSRYIKGINHLYEFNAGAYSGWIYKVNDKFPDEGCSDYKLKDKDVIVWEYTCGQGDIKGSGL